MIADEAVGEKLDRVRGRRRFLGRDEMCQFTERINDDEDAVVAPRGGWETRNKVKTDMAPAARGDEGFGESGRFLGKGLGCPTLHAGLNIGSCVSPHAWPIMELTKGQEGLLLATVARGNVIMVAVKDMGQELGQGADTDAPESVDADVQVGVAEPEGIAAAQQLVLDLLSVPLPGGGTGLTEVRTEGVGRFPSLGGHRVRSRGANGWGF
ncbi:hypothetical protein EBH_0073920 [Eimeria brunetti]|uniref:Uncharacterized protein n=1 Tax=Eimeria brunetti TaxID=51314 RepID=U6LUN6_9EIME|nr:hypothetical protein EBH_0073920 [Eimeria brunetti]